MKEVWRDVINYKGTYKVSNTGKVGRVIKYGTRDGRYGPGDIKPLKLQKLKSGYLSVALSLNSIVKVRTVHSLVAEAFLNHRPCGYTRVIDHIDFDKTNNNVNNLRVVTHRVNVGKNQKKNKTSEYPGVSWDSFNKKWIAAISINGKNCTLGRFSCEEGAATAYQNKLLTLKE